MATESNPEGIRPSLARLDLEAGALVQHATGVFRVQMLVNFEELWATNVETGRPKVLPITELTVLNQGGALAQQSPVELEDIEDNGWRTARSRYQAIRPLIESGTYTGSEVEECAKKIGVSRATLYRWLGRFRNMDAVSGLVPFKRGWREGNLRLSSPVEKVIQEVLKDYYLKDTRPFMTKTLTVVEERCLELGLEPPSMTTLRDRIARIPEFDRMKARGKREKAKAKFVPVPGSLPGADFPLALVQIDHTPIDLIVVDDEHRKPINRAWLTVAIDVYSRMVVGYYLSLDSPSVTSVALCVAHAMLPKEEWLLSHGVEAKWPVWGRPRVIHVDNGPDFRAGDIRKSCEQHQIELIFRPVKRAHYGGHIERLQGTLLRDLHELPGTTFASVAERQGYDSDAHAALTLEDLELQLLKLIANEYHRKPHSALGMPPLRRWELGVFGGPDAAPSGMQPRPVDRLGVLLSFLPSFERTVQADGVTIDGIRYYGDALRPWIGSEDRETKKARMHLFRRDPRDASVAYFFDPDMKQYFRVEYVDLSSGQFSLWEHKAARAALKEAGFDPSDEAAVRQSIQERRQLVERAASATKQARRQAQRQREHAKRKNPVAPPKHPSVDAQASRSDAQKALPKAQQQAASSDQGSMLTYEGLGLSSTILPVEDVE